jgi:nucleotidyltransferase/DNA polymerase involved in DNA repair
MEVLRHPVLEGRPLVLGNAPGGRQEVQLCSPEAERAGIRVGLPLREVVPLCPAAVIVQPDPVRTATLLDEVSGALEQVVPAVEPSTEDVFLDLRGMELLYEGRFELLARAILAAVPPLLHPRLGIAAGRFVASAAARATPAQGMRVVSPEDAKSFLAPLPVKLLPLAPPDLARLDWLGLRRIGDLAGLPFSAVQAQFGPSGARAWRLAQGQDDQQLVPRRTEPSVQATLRFESPLASFDAVMHAIDELVSRVFADPDLRGRAARRVRLRALLSDGTSWERVIAFKEQLSGRLGAFRGLKGKLELPNGLPPAPIEELELELRQLTGETGRQAPMFGVNPVRFERIAEAARQLRALYGRIPLYHAVEVEAWSRIPERRWALISPEY